MRAHAKTSRDTAKSYEVCFHAMDCKLQLGVDVKVPPDGRTRVNMRVTARPTPDASFVFAPPTFDHVAADAAVVVPEDDSGVVPVEPGEDDVDDVPPEPPARPVTP